VKKRALTRVPGVRDRAIISEAGKCEVFSR
jgi:hypothetical protein